MASTSDDMTAWRIQQVEEENDRRYEALRERIKELEERIDRLWDEIVDDRLAAIDAERAAQSASTS